MRAVKVVKLLPIILPFVISSFIVILTAQAYEQNDISPTETGTTLSCKDEQGNDVNWFIAYKLPKLPQTADPLFQHGSGYFFILPGNDKWQRSSRGIHDQSSILAVTTTPLYSHDPNLAYFLYNDQPPNQTAVVRDGHTKGLIISNANGGLWLPHSVPHFPIPGASFGYPVGGLENGQMFFCVSLNASEIDLLGTMLEYTKPKIYEYNLPDNLKALYPTLFDVATLNTTAKKAPWYKSLRLDAKGLNISLFVKGPKFRKEMYSDWIAPSYKTSLNVQSWLNGAHPFQSNCTSDKFPVYNVLDKTIASQNFSTITDHSKWAVGVDQPVTCIGDLNRMKPQKSRGGMAMCITEPQVWTAFKAIVTDIQPCKKVPRANSFWNFYRSGVQRNGNFYFPQPVPIPSRYLKIKA